MFELAGSSSYPSSRQLVTILQAELYVFSKRVLNSKKLTFTVKFPDDPLKGNIYWLHKNTSTKRKMYLSNLKLPMVSTTIEMSGKA